MKRFADRLMTPQNWDKLEQLESFARQSNRSLLDITMGWLATRSFIPSVIAGASTPEQLDLNEKVVNCALSAEEAAKAEAIFGWPPKT